MLRKLISKIGQWLVRLAEKKATAEDVINRGSSNKRNLGKMAETHKTSTNRDEMDVRNSDKNRVDAFESQRTIEDIQAELIAKGYKELPNILEQYPDEMIAQYVQMQANLLGSGIENMDGMRREDLIKSSMELNMLLWKQRQIEQGKARPTTAQMETIKSLSARLRIAYVAPQDKFEASEMIESMKARLPHIEMVGNITKGQANAIEKMAKKAGLQIAVTEIKDVRAASELIDTLAKLPANQVATLCTDAQVDYLKRLYKTLNKRWLKKVEDKFRAMSAKDVSKAIDELKGQLPADMKATEGQVEYIITLCDRIGKPCNPDDTRNLMKSAATKLIEGLQRDYLYLLYKAQGNRIDRKDLESMKSEDVKKLIKQLTEENKTHDYKGFPVNGVKPNDDIPF